jgi:hypothetical protein
MAQLVARANLHLPREWRHYLYIPDENLAKGFARVLDATGWNVEVCEPESAGESFALVAVLENVVLTGKLVSKARELFQQVASLIPGAEYDGWEVSVSEDEYHESGQ